VKKTKQLPIIRIGKISPCKPMVKMDVTIEDDDFYKMVCDQARKEIPDDKLFEWWFRKALEETVTRLETKKLKK